ATSAARNGTDGRPPQPGRRDWSRVPSAFHPSLGPKPSGDFVMFPIRKILHPTDFSNRSQAAFEVGCALARDYGAELVVVHVNHPPPVFAPDEIALPGPVEEPYELRARLAGVRPSDSRVKVEYHLLDGDPADEIVKAAKIRGADLIVMGTHGTTGLV